MYRKFIVTRVGPGGRFTSADMMVLATLIRTVCPAVIPTSPKETRSLTGGGNWSCALVASGAMNVPSADNDTRAAKTAISKSLTFIFFLPPLIGCWLTPDHPCFRPTAACVFGAWLRPVIHRLP